MLARRADVRMVSLSPALTSEARLCAAVGSQLPADPPKLQSTVSQLPSIEAVRRLLSGGHRHRSWAAALAAARHTWAELRRRWQLSEPFDDSALPLPGGGGGRCRRCQPVWPAARANTLPPARPVSAATATGPPAPRTDDQFACSRSCAQRAVVLSAVVAGAACFKTGSAAFAPAPARNAFSSPAIDRTLRTFSMMETGKCTLRPLQLLHDARELQPCCPPPPRPLATSTERFAPRAAHPLYPLRARSCTVRRNQGVCLGSDEGHGQRARGQHVGVRQGPWWP